MSGTLEALILVLDSSRTNGDYIKRGILDALWFLSFQDGFFFGGDGSLRSFRNADLVDFLT